VAELERLGREAERRRETAAKAAARVAEIDRLLPAAAEAVEAARSRFEAARAAMDPATAALTVARTRRDHLAQQLAAAGVDARAEQELDRLRRVVTRIDAGLAEARERLDHAQSTHARAEAQATACAAEAARAADVAVRAAEDAGRCCFAEGFDGAAACRAALVDADARAGLAATIEERAVRAKAAADAARTLRTELHGIERPEVAALERAREAAARDASETAAAVVRLGGELDQVAQTESRLAELASESRAVEEQLRLVGGVAEVVRGRNGLNMSLQRFVLAARLEEVADAASRRLAVMSRGRFRLRHDTTVRHRSQAAGLSLVVEDAWTGVTDRPAGALSGGESFLASLALALGLSDVVLRRSGGVHLDALFVDEGFGSLDEDTLDDALRALGELRASGRLVGVISHVAELRSRIPARIEVHKGASGSTLTVRTG
jgi:exonuclease SbcC